MVTFTFIPINRRNLRGKRTCSHLQWDFHQSHLAISLTIYIRIYKLEMSRSAFFSRVFRAMKAQKVHGHCISKSANLHLNGAAVRERNIDIHNQFYVTFAFRTDHLCPMVEAVVLCGIGVEFNLFIWIILVMENWIGMSEKMFVLSSLSWKV